jgi:hypothetical protein
VAISYLRLWVGLPENRSIPAKSKRFVSFYKAFGPALGLTQFGILLGAHPILHISRIRVNGFVFILKTHGVSCEWRTWSLNKIEIPQFLPNASLPACIPSFTKSNQMGSKCSCMFVFCLLPSRYPLHIPTPYHAYCLSLPELLGYTPLHLHSSTFSVVTL